MRAVTYPPLVAVGLTLPMEYMPLWREARITTPTIFERPSLAEETTRRTVTPRRWLAVRATLLQATSASLRAEPRMLQAPTASPPAGKLKQTMWARSCGLMHNQQILPPPRTI